MNKKMRELLAKINSLRTEARAALDENKLEEASAKAEEIKALQKEFDVEAALYEGEKNGVPDDPHGAGDASAVNGFEIMCKVARKQPLTEAEAALVTGGSNGEDYTIPEDVHLEIIELKRKYKSAVDLCTVIPTDSVMGSFNFEEGTAPTALTDFTDGETLTDSDEPKIVRKQFSCKQWGNIIGISNRLVASEKAHIMALVDKWFAKKAILTENIKIFNVLKEDKTAKVVADVDDLLTTMELDIDPAVTEDGVKIVTNQHGFLWLALQEDADGNKLLHRDITNPAIMRFNGAVVEKYPTSQLPNTDNKAPLFIGDTKSGVYFIPRQRMSMAASEHAFFDKNQKALRIIEDFDVIGADKEAYVFAEVDVTDLITQA